MSQNPDENPMDSKFEFWTQLPTEMRLECIRKMDFKTRMQLRATSKQDKLFVESTPKYQFDSVEVELNAEYVSNVTCKKSDRSEVYIGQDRGKTTPAFLEKALQFAVQVLKFAKTEKFEFSPKFATDNDVSHFLAKISNLAAFHFKSIALNCSKFEVIDFFLKNCNSLESIELERCDNEFDMTKMMEFISFSTVINAKTVQIVDLKAAEIPYQLIKKWFEKEDLELGKTLRIGIESADFINFLARKFENRVVSKTVETLRLRTKGPAGNHIFFRKIPNGSFFEQPTQVPCYSAIVIPSDKKDSEIENDDQFMKDICAKQWKRNCAPLDFHLPMEVRVELDPDLLAAALGQPEHYSDDEDFY